MTTRALRQKSSSISISGASTFADAPLAILRGRHRRRFLLKTRRDSPPQGVVKMWLDGLKIPSKVRLQIDINPYSFL